MNLKMIARCSIAILCTPFISSGQFSNLVTTTTGDRVFFVTPLRQPGLSQYPHAKLFRLDLSSPESPATSENLPTLSLLIQLPWHGASYLSPGFVPTNVRVSADGRFVAYTTFDRCSGGSSCLFRELAAGSVLDVTTGTSVFKGRKVWVSRNGRYVLSQPTGGTPGTQLIATILDRTTNQSHDLPAASVVALSSKGDALLNHGSDTELVSWSGPSRSFPVTGAVAMDDAATTILFANRWNNSSQRRLYVYDIASGQQWQLGPDDRASYGPSLSDDGRWVLYVTNLSGTPQLMLSHPDGSNWKQVTADPSGIGEGVLSGDGRVSWAATEDGRLLRVSTDTADAVQVLAPPMLIGNSWGVVPGSLLRLDGLRLGTDVHIEGVPVPVISASASEMDVQVPWDLPKPSGQDGNLAPIISSTRADSPLEAATPEYSTYWQSVRPSGWSAPIHEDWKSLVSDQNPANPGEVLHVYAVGLGPTNCYVALGQPAPLDRLCTPKATIPWLWSWTGPNGPDRLYATVPFAGLAPGLIGLYQIDVQVLAYPPASRLELYGDQNMTTVVADVPVRK